MISVNEYFDGKVKSIAFEGSALPATVGVMDVGEFVFSTSQFEVMTVIDGLLRVRLPGETDYSDYSSGSSFEVPANASFDVIVARQTAYHCTYQ